MTNQVHLLLTPESDAGPSRLMQLVGQRYVRAINRAHVRTGTLWEGRFRSTVATDEAYILACYRLFELNPVRAGMVTHPRDYPWSSHRANAELDRRVGPLERGRKPKREPAAPRGPS